MAERRRVRRSGDSGGSGSRASTRSRERSDRDERDRIEAESLEEDEFLDEGEYEEDDEQMRDADDPEAAGEDEPAANGRRRPARSGQPAMTAGDAAKAALREIAALTAKQPEGVTAVKRAEDGWTVGIELVEDKRIPSSADILAIYETTIDADGELLSYRRVRRYPRGRGDTEEP